MHIDTSITERKPSKETVVEYSPAHKAFKNVLEAKMVALKAAVGGGTLVATASHPLHAQNIVRSRLGRAFIAIRDQDIAAEILGINVRRYKLTAFAISSFYAGVTGVLFVYYSGVANNEFFPLVVSIDYLAMVIIGGAGSVLGAIFGAIFVTILPIGIDQFMSAVGPLFTDDIGALAGIKSHLRLVVFGGLIMFFLVVEPDGLNRLWLNIRNYFRVWPFGY